MYGWQSIESEKIPANLKGWLLDVNHLKLALTEQGFAISLILLKQEQGVLSAEEAQLLKSETGLIRQIYLADKGKPLVYARTVIPAQTYQAFATEFENLGARAIGEILLHDKEQVIRGPLEAGYIEADSDLYNAAAGNNLSLTAPLWARRSQFYMANHPLLITEIFLSLLPAYHAKI